MLMRLARKAMWQHQIFMTDKVLQEQQSAYAKHKIQRQQKQTLCKEESPKTKSATATHPTAIDTSSTTSGRRRQMSPRKAVFSTTFARAVKNKQQKEKKSKRTKNRNDAISHSTYPLHHQPLADMAYQVQNQHPFSTAKAALWQGLQAA